MHWRRVRTEEGLWLHGSWSGSLGLFRIWVVWMIECCVIDSCGIEAVCMTLFWCIHIYYHNRLYAYRPWVWLYVWLRLKGWSFAIVSRRVVEASDRWEELAKDVPCEWTMHNRPRPWGHVLIVIFWVHEAIGH